jgi:Ca2+-binding RTX toxin-like protein
VLLYMSATGDGRLTISDHTIPTTTSPACEVMTDYSVANCEWNPAAGVRVDLGDADDRVTVFDDLPATTPIAVAGGTGSDELSMSIYAGPATLDGGAGDDVLKAGGGADALIGGDGNDTIEGRNGADQIQGGAGDDKLSGDGNFGTNGDAIDGGPGVDAIESDWYQETSTTTEISVSLAGGADDGRSGEGDDIRAVERIISHAPGTLVGTDAGEHLEVFQILGGTNLVGHGGPDTLKGADGPDRLDGGAGDDMLDARYGDDHVVGGPGRDTILADQAGGECSYLWCKFPYGNDTVDARDGERDSVTCGAGQDSVQADAVDVVAPDCETVTRGGAAPGPGGGAGPGSGGGALAASVRRVKLSRALSRGMKVRATAPGAGSLTATAKANGKVAAGASRSVKKAGRTTVVLRFTKKARRTLRRSRRVKLGVAIRFAPQRGAAIRQRLAVTLTR